MGSHAAKSPPSESLEDRLAKLTAPSDAHCTQADLVGTWVMNGPETVDEGFEQHVEKLAGSGMSILFHFVKSPMASLRLEVGIAWDGDTLLMNQVTPMGSVSMPAPLGQRIKDPRNHYTKHSEDKWVVASWDGGALRIDTVFDDGGFTRWFY